MQIIYSFGVSPLTYALRGIKNHFPEMKNCPICHHPEALEKHGFYWRNALFSKRQFRIPIRRFKCSSCGKTISFLPDYLLPYFQYCLIYILESLRGFFYRASEKFTTSYCSFTGRDF